MKCTSKIISIVLTMVLALTLTGCAGKAFEMPYSTDSYNSSFSISDQADARKGEYFASNLCVTDGNETGKVSFKLENAAAAGLFDVKNHEVVYALNVHTKVDPASITKVLTALLAIKYSDPDEYVIASQNACSITESGAQLLNLQPGDTMTMNQALHALLMYSANDVAVAIAEHVGGTEAEFAEMMNEEAKKIGATNSHFVNSNGLTDENHYVTAYDLYLIFNEACKYDTFTEIIGCNEYTATYTDKNGSPKEMSLGTTNLFLKGTYDAPGNISVIGGKTGTTSAAKNCLIILCKDSKGNPYIAVVMKAEERGILYEIMQKMLATIS